MHVMRVHLPRTEAAGLPTGRHEQQASGAAYALHHQPSGNPLGLVNLFDDEDAIAPKNAHPWPNAARVDNCTAKRNAGTRAQGDSALLIFLSQR
eukprot:795180-Pelagomonas_calceolata.AAC.4